MKKILLLGDSIRGGYEKHVKEAFSDVAKVYFPNDNCRFTGYFLRSLHDWKRELELEDVDLVHWNVGLWDTLTLYEDGPHTPIAYYKENLDRIYRRIQILFPSAKQVFATSTRVQEELYTDPACIRRNCDIEEYNQAAIEVLSKYDIPINDLYALTKTMDESYYSDMTHLCTDKGSEKILKAVHDSICESLGIEHQVDPKAVVKQLNYTAEVIGI